MDSEARLLRVLAVPAAPKRDPGFTMAVIRAAEGKRYREQTIRSMLKAAGVAAAAASLALPFLGWAVGNAQALQTGMLGAACLVTLVGAARVLSSRATAVLRQ